MYPGVKRFIDETIDKARADGHTETMLGRRRPLSAINSEDGRVRAFSERVAVNTPIQGTAADMIKIAMIGIDQEIGQGELRSSMILQVHDELVFDVVPDELERMETVVRTCMERAITLSVPLRVDIATGKNWMEAHP
jgi:DNA polymerase-1